MSKDKKPQCPFIQRFAEDLKLFRKSERTVQSYCRALRKLNEYLGHEPRQALRIISVSIGIGIGIGIGC